MRLQGLPGWSEWIGSLRRPLDLRPLVVGPGLPVSPAFLVGFSLELFPDLEISPYDIGPAAVTEVCARAGATALSHSENDVPAPPHTAAFFDPEPPLVLGFACDRPHPGGGAETTVCNVPRVLQKLSPAARRELEGSYTYRRPRRLGSTRHAFRVLQELDGLPAIRYRLDYMEERSATIAELDGLLNMAENQYVVPMQAGDYLFAHNGAPHGRLPQRGPTGAPGTRRRLIRNRLRRKASRRGYRRPWL